MNLWCEKVQLQRWVQRCQGKSRACFARLRVKSMRRHMQVGGCWAQDRSPLVSLHEVWLLQGVSHVAEADIRAAAEGG